MPDGPDQFDVDLYWGAQAWLQISAKLSEGLTVDEAVRHANDFLDQHMPRFKPDGQPLPLLKFKTVGDEGVTIR